MGFNKALDFPSSKTIFKKTLGSSKPCSSSFLGPSSYRNSKAKAEHHHKSSFKTSFEPPYSSHFFASSSKSRNRSLTSTSLVNREPFHVFYYLKFWASISMLLLCLFALKLIHRSFDKEKNNLNDFIFKHMPSRNIPKCFKLHHLETFHCVSILEFSNYPLFVTCHINYVEYLISKPSY